MTRFFAVILLLLLAGCKAQPEAQLVTVEGEGRPALWRVTSADGKGGAAYLFGTVHLLPRGTAWQSSAIDAAIRASDELVVEVTGLDDQQSVSNLFAEMGIARGLPQITSRVPASLRAKLEKMIDSGDTPVHVLNQMKSWAAALTLASSINNDLGLSREGAPEHIFQLRFEADDKATSGLESVSQQFGFFDGLPEREQRVLLADIIRNADKGRADYKAMLTDWMAGNSNHLLDSANAGMLASPIIREALLDDRNRNWTAQISAMLGKGHHPFIAVGAGHLAGPGGVPALLQAQGYKVTRVQ